MQVLVELGHVFYNLHNILHRLYNHLECRSKFHDDEPSNFDDAKSPSDWFKIDWRLQDQALRIQSKIQDSREEIKKQQVKTSHRISIKNIFFKNKKAQFCFTKEFFQYFLSYQNDYSLVIDYQWPIWFQNIFKCFATFQNDFQIV